ncbi:hypothetical protein M2310_006938 [Rhizobium leguminosarum]|uniref:Uncharacterized protein n=1 Tax=Rhizobium esperanzae TaxID=1967781 RepID=A0A7W6XYJ2_9HYPH|nr:hypothetical protein [Rhizobium esperanzae]MDH6206246.1 hypothetical protein [Rhizobium leguminosarum]
MQEAILGFEAAKAETFLPAVDLDAVGTEDRCDRIEVRAVRRPWRDGVELNRMFEGMSGGRNVSGKDGHALRIDDLDFQRACNHAGKVGFKIEPGFRPNGVEAKR